MNNADAILKAWIGQLKELREKLETGEHVEVTLYANKGRVRRRPVVTYYAGPVDYIDPSEASET